MGIFTSCCKGSVSDYTTPDMETRRRQQVDAAERRIKEQEHRGIKDPERVKRMQQRSEAIEAAQEEAARYNTAPGLKWQMS